MRSAPPAIDSWAAQQAPERLDELRRPALRIRVDLVGNAEGDVRGHFPCREGIGQQAIPHGEQSTEVLVRRLGRMMDAVQPRRDDEWLDRAQVDVQVGMDEHRPGVEQAAPECDGFGGQPEDDQPEGRQRAPQQLLEDVRSSCAGASSMVERILP